MLYKVITAAAAEPVTLAEAKLHLRVDHTSDDALISTLIVVAREFAEHYAGRALGTQTLEMALDAFPASDGDITLAMPPVASITSISYTDTNGVSQTLATANYALSTYGISRRVSVTYGNSWPSTREMADAVRIRYVAGSPIPSAVKSAILLLVGHLYENRQDATAMKLESIPTGAAALLDTVRVYS